MLLADENFPIASIRRLRSVGFDVVAIVEEIPGATDAQILRRAEQEQRIILTFDRDYGEFDSGGFWADSCRDFLQRPRKPIFTACPAVLYSLAGRSIDPGANRHPS